MHQSVPLKAASAQPRSLCASRLGHHQVHEAITASVGATEGPRRASTPSLMMPRRKEPLDQARHTRGTTPSSNNNSSSLPRRGDQNHQHSTFAASSKQILDALGGGCDDAYRGANVLELRQWLLQRLSSSLSVSTMDNSSIRVHPAVAVGDDGRDSAPVAATQRRLTDADALALPFWSAWQKAQKRQQYRQKQQQPLKEEDYRTTRLSPPPSHMLSSWHTVRWLLFPAQQDEVGEGQHDHSDQQDNEHHLTTRDQQDELGGQEETEKMMLLPRDDVMMDRHRRTTSESREVSNTMIRMSMMPSAAELLRSAHKPIALLCQQLCRPPPVFLLAPQPQSSGDDDNNSEAGRGDNDDEVRDSHFYRQMQADDVHCREQDSLIAMFRLLYDAPRSSRRVNETVTAKLEPSTPLRITPTLVKYVWTMLLAVLSPPPTPTPALSSSLPSATDVSVEENGSQSAMWLEAVNNASCGIWDELVVKGEVKNVVGKPPSQQQQLPPPCQNVSSEDDDDDDRGASPPLQSSTVTAAPPATVAVPSVLLYRELTDDPKHAWYCCCTLWIFQLMNLSCVDAATTTSTAFTATTPADSFTTLLQWLQSSPSSSTAPPAADIGSSSSSKKQPDNISNPTLSLLPQKSRENLWRLLDSTISSSSSSQHSGVGDASQQNSAAARLAALRRGLHESLCIWLELITKIVALMERQERRTIAAPPSVAVFSITKRKLEQQQCHERVLRALVTAVLHPSYTISLNPISIGGPKASATSTGSKKGFGTCTASTVPEVHSRTLTQLREAGERRGAREAEDRTRLRLMSLEESDRVSRSIILREASEEAMYVQRRMFHQRSSHREKKQQQGGDEVEAIRNRTVASNATTPSLLPTTTRDANNVAAPRPLNATTTTTTDARQPFAAVSRILQSYEDAFEWRQRHRNRDDAIHGRKWARQVRALPVSAKVKTYFS